MCLEQQPQANKARAWLREPLLHFALLGILLFALDAFLQPGAGRPVIEVTSGDIERIRAQWLTQWRQPPDPEQLEEGIEQFLREEVLYREALAMGLDRDDPIVRRRLAQKLRLLVGRPGSMVPEEAELADFYRQNSAAYTEPALASFTHIFFAADRAGAPAQELAQSTLALVQTGTSPVDDLGDPHWFDSAYQGLSQNQIRRLFGSGFADALRTLPQNIWQGPIDSVYGTHLVRVDMRTEANLPPLSEVRDDVLRDLHRWQSEQAIERFIEQSLARYRVIIDTENASQTDQAGDDDRGANQPHPGDSR